MSAGPSITRSGVSMTLPFTSRSAGVVRDELGSWLRACGRASGVMDDARLVVTELVGNAVRHASPLDPGVVLVSWQERAGDLELSVTDGGGVMLPTRCNASPTGTEGRGLAIVDALSSHWWVDQRRKRKTVHALLPLA